MCGKSYESCRTTHNDPGVFRWQEVACSPECGAIYLQKLKESRGLCANKQIDKTADIPTSKSEPVKRPARKKVMAPQ